MRKVLPLAIMLALPAMASADTHGCLVSFSGATHDVCSGNTVASGSALNSLLSHSAVDRSTLRIVKFDGPIGERQRHAVEAAGARIIGYAPHYAYIVRMPATLDSTMQAIDGVVWSGPMLPALKVDPNIYTTLDGDDLIAALGVERLEITLDTRASLDASRSAIASVAGLLDAQTMNVGGELLTLARFERDALAGIVEQLAQRDDVLSVGLHLPARSYNSQGQWLHQSNENSPSPQTPVWDRGVYGCGQTVGVLDTGLYQDNRAFRDDTQVTPIDVCTSGTSCPSISPNNDARKVVAYYKWSGLSGGSWADNHGHGTHVAGSVAGNDSFSKPGVDCTNFTTAGGGTNLDGMATGAKLVIQETGSNLAYLNQHGGNPYHAAEVAYQSGARIHNNSWGSGCVSSQTGLCVSGCTIPYRPNSRHADRIMQDHDDLLMVFAAGNDGTQCPNGNNVGSPGNAKNVLSIGATSRGTAANNMASYSSRGPALDSRTKPDLTAQGSSVQSAGRSESGVAGMSGTSMASPTAAGLAALVRDYLASGFYPSGQRTPADAMPDASGALVKAVMATGAFRMTGSGAGANPGQAQGFGRILLDDSLHFVGDDTRLFIHDEEIGLTANESHTYQLSATSDERLTFILTWTDEPGSVNASPATVNSLRLEVKAPNGDVWTQKLPAGFNVNNANPTQDTSTSNYDNLNNLHRIQFDAPALGVYEIQVRGINVPMGPQTYALAAAGGFDISTEPDFNLSVTPGAVEICAGSDAQFDIGVLSRYEFVDPVTLSVSGVPATAGSSFTPNPLTPAAPAAISQLLVHSTDSVASGSYPLTINGVSSGAGPISHDIAATLAVKAGLPGDPVLALPADGATDVPLIPTFSWADDAEATEYTIQVATDAGFSNIVASGSSNLNTWSPDTELALQTTYYWRVGANNVCGDSDFSAAYSFTTPPAYTVGGEVDGLTGEGLVLWLNGASSLPISADGPFEFDLGLADGTPYVVVVGTHPFGQSCEVSNGEGTIAAAHVTDVEVLCEDLPPVVSPVGGQLRNMSAGNEIVLQLNGDQTITRRFNGVFSFNPGLATETAYEVTVHTQPEGQNCIVSNGSGVMGFDPITDIDVNCAIRGPDIFEDGFEGAGGD
ncbi:MAG: S8 family serine peptidase [Lysobacteraceae bacterium]